MYGEFLNNKCSEQLDLCQYTPYASVAKIMWYLGLGVKVVVFTYPFHKSEYELIVMALDNFMWLLQEKI